MITARNAPKIAAWKYTPVAYGVLLIAGLLDLWMSLLLPQALARHGLDRLGVDAIAASIVVVQMGIWWVAMRAANDFMRYIQTIHSTPDGKGMMDIAKALLWLIAYIVLVPLTASLANITTEQSYSAFVVFLHNHLPIVAMLVAVGYLYRGSRRLVRLTSRPLHRGWLAVTLVAFMVIAAAFVWHCVAVIPDMLKSNTNASFALPLRVLVVTYITPQLIVWFVGVLAVFNLWHYSTQVAGSIYRMLFSSLYQGIFLVFVCTFIVQFIIASTITLSSLNTGVAMVCVVLLLGVVGYVRIYGGVNRLIKLEAVT